ncbi:heptosyltransferase [Pseudalgibacter alginicilyticus]|uniref:Heptosyltransferase n=2 Tax=Pseudalgibacter alginicilyticus TaxID=1736674 RepID=A0A0P0D9K3_9FLAO|nr:heptosyltransferase [Pseudalgibacter alginicilyticus]
MGDVAMLVPVLRAFIQQNPEVKITVLTRDFFKPFFRDLPKVVVFAADVKGKHKGVLGLYKLSKELKKLKIDAVADLHNVVRSNILKYFFLGTPFLQLNKGRQEKRDLISGKVFNQLKTTHQRYADVFEALGYKVDLRHPEFPKASQLSHAIESIVKKDFRKWIGVAPFAAHESKMYPLNLMEQVIESLSKNYKIILFGGGDKEVKILNDFEAKYEHVCNVAGKITLDEELDLISNLSVMLSMDSGNAHLAAMLGIKTITIWGVTHPYAGFAPFNQPEDYTLLPDRYQFPKTPTSVYGNKYPEGYKTVAGSILPEIVVNKIKSILK